MKPDTFAHGVTNETEDGKFLVFLDYDGVAYRKVLKDVRLLMDTGYICAAAVLKNSEEEMMSIDGKSELKGNYNVLTFCKLGFRDCEEAIGLTRCEYHFKKHIRVNPQRNHVIRLGAKFREQVPSSPLKRKLKAGKLVKPMPVLKEVVTTETGSCSREHSRAHVDMARTMFGAEMDYFRRLDAFTEVEAVRYGTQGKISHTSADAEIQGKKTPPSKTGEGVIA